ncbi:MAG TPA: bifunctional 4-hydroxy-2-oxoglutarate aldolase/2-dehydro-3-deoxy-phosphogluconate aldolase [Pyrinomonadaceae bacterium]|jgi:2-dehydro-3-deoxyphosphogluconate aldolase/(4S)-4-hydroxy-2-oxoglutarate aldolase|nr:bifunctional 4-hydroxy-2-oxoglutarate aldolase/2-dehydro-3-deoxy-phosphogluconate aldolase [Pyrinomonadaceae bacterium]
MHKNDVIKQIRDTGIIPVVRANSADDAMSAIDAIREGGVSVLEITMTVPGALNVIAQVAARYGDDAIVGAGTVLDAETARACILNGAQFVVSPALNLETIACCRKYGIVVLPGALTPTEVVAAWTAGADFVKVFPAGSLGGASYIKSLKAPLPQIEMVPTGGVSMKTAADFIKAGSSALGVGADLVDLKAIRDGQLSVITERAKQYVEIVREARGI